jgi:hypothetical protein
MENKDIKDVQNELFLKMLSKPMKKLFGETGVPTIVHHMNATFDTALNAFNADDQKERLWNADEVAKHFSHHAALVDFVAEVGTLWVAWKKQITN